MMEGLQISIPRRMLLVRITLILSLIISIFLSLNLWGGFRSFPKAPLLSNDFILAPYDMVYVALAILSWIASMFLNKQRVFIFLSFALSVFLIFLDVNRCQPWFYIYNAMLAVYLFYNGRVDDPNKFTAFFIMLQIIFASVYFFCGISQLNSLFIDSDFLEIISPLREVVSERQFLFFKKMGFISPYLLIFIGFGLIISPVRYLAITLALLMHFFLLIFLFPSEHNKNYALWFSNLSFMIMLFLLFSGKTKQRYFSPTFLFQIPLFYLIIPVFVVMPFFNSSGRWPDFLSSNFKSGNEESAIITFGKKTYAALPLYEKNFCILKDSVYILDYKRWCLHELNADCFPEKLVFNSIYNSVESLNTSDVKEIELQLLPRQKVLRKP